jgi:hypothetical protein
MAEILHCAGRITRDIEVIATGIAGKIAAALRLKMAK